YDHRSDVSAALHHAHHDNLILAASASNNALTLRLMHVAGLAADEGFIYFDFTGQLAALLALLCESDSVEHKPRGFLSDIKCPRHFTTTNTVLAIQNQPHCRKPLIQTERRLLEDSPDLHRELPFRMPIAALPAELIL